jgi:hypothetical protein
LIDTAIDHEPHLSGDSCRNFSCEIVLIQVIAAWLSNINFLTGFYFTLRQLLGKSYYLQTFSCIGDYQPKEMTSSRDIEQTSAIVGQVVSKTYVEN